MNKANQTFSKVMVANVYQLSKLRDLYYKPPWNLSYVMLILFIYEIFIIIWNVYLSMKNVCINTDYSDTAYLNFG